MGSDTLSTCPGRCISQNFPVIMESVCVVLKLRYEDYRWILRFSEYTNIIDEQLWRGVGGVERPPGFITCLTKQLFARILLLPREEWYMTFFQKMVRVLHVSVIVAHWIFSDPFVSLFRENRVFVVWDIDKAFLNVEVGPWDGDCLHLLWMEEPPDLSQVVVYRFCRVLFKLNATASRQTVWNIPPKVCSKVALSWWFCQGWSDITGRLIELHQTLSRSLWPQGTNKSSNSECQGDIPRDLYQKCCWDKQLGEGSQRVWIKSLIDCQRIDVKSCVYEHSQGEVEQSSLHGFSHILFKEPV